MKNKQDLKKEKTIEILKAILNLYKEIENS